VESVPLLLDVTPLRESAAYRRMFTGLALGQLGQQMTAVAVAIQVYDITRSSLAVGGVGLAMLLPMVFCGLYGGALADSLDRRKLAIVTALGLWIASGSLLVVSLFHVRHVWVFYLIVAVQGGLFAVNAPTRQAIIPRLLPLRLIPAANALGTGGFNVGLTLGPLLGAALVAWQGYQAAYGVDVLTYLIALYALFKLPPMPPQGRVQRAGLRSVLDGLRYLKGNQVVLGSFVADMNAMALSSPRALFPAAAVVVFAGGAQTVGYLQAAPAVGALVALGLSGWFGRIKRHGLVVLVAVACWGVAIAAFGLSPGLKLGLVCLAAAGAADSISSVFRGTILQAATPDEMRGRLQGVFTVVVAGVPRLGDFMAGSLGQAIGTRQALVVCGCACVVGIGLISRLMPKFREYIRIEHALVE
jgi:MFS family permease